MINHALIEVIDNINDKYIDEAINYQCKKVAKFNRWQMFGVAAACLCLVVGIGTHQYNYHYSVDSIVDIDVNPSIELRISKAERVLSVEALNEDAQIVLEGMKLENVDLDTAVDAIIGSLIEKDYLDEVKNAINVYVKNDDEEAGAELGQKLTEEIILVLEENSLVGKVKLQTHATNSELTELAAAYGVSEGVEGTDISKAVEEGAVESTAVEEQEQVVSEDIVLEGETEEVSSEALSEIPEEVPSEALSTESREVLIVESGEVLVEAPSIEPSEVPIVEPSEAPKGELGNFPNDRPGGDKGNFHGGFPNGESGERPGKNNDRKWDYHDNHQMGMGYFDWM